MRLRGILLISKLLIEMSSIFCISLKPSSIAALLALPATDQIKGLGYGQVCISLLSPFCVHEIRCEQEPIAAPIMAPHALQGTYDSTGYTPSIDNYAKFLPYIRVLGSVQASPPNTPVLTSNDVSIRLTAGESKSEHFWHLSPHEIQDIEASMNFFQCKLP